MNNSVQTDKLLFKLPTALIWFRATASEDLAKILHNVFASLPDNVGIWRDDVEIIEIN